jgi:hypothetical protein
MPNPNKNKHFNDEALRINRRLKKENDELKRQLEEIYEALVSENGYIEKHNHPEIINWIYQLIIEHNR